jgi:hypothetical protein
MTIHALALALDLRRKSRAESCRLRLIVCLVFSGAERRPVGDVALIPIGRTRHAGSWRTSTSIPPRRCGSYRTAGRGRRSAFIGNLSADRRSAERSGARASEDLGGSRDRAHAVPPARTGSAMGMSGVLQPASCGQAAHNQQLEGEACMEFSRVTLTLFVPITQLLRIGSRHFRLR